MRTIKKEIKTNVLDLLKESKEQRLERVRQDGARFRPKIVEPKNRYKRKKFRPIDFI
jgi:hypothetical protein